MKGTIKRLVSDKKFGFIAPEDNSKDVFFHVTGLSGVQFNDLNVGDTVEFDLEETDKGPKAVNITR